MTCCRHLYFLVLITTVVCHPVAAAEPSTTEFDLLTPPLGAGGSFWRAFSEDATDTAEVWKFSDGLLICKGSPRGYLCSIRDFTNFTLRLQWRWPADTKPGKGGVLLRMTGPDKIWPKSLEAQINAGDAGDFWGLDGYLLGGPADRVKVVEHPQFGRLTNLKKTAALERPAGQWNDYVITVRDATVTLEINGRTVNQATGCSVRPGKICLTAEGNEIHFRNVRLTPLDR
jgi:hypothetical protein